jgi:F-type H+-transporting ATPase subunit a
VKHFFEPVPFLFPLNVLEELVKPFSLALRLFGNMFGEEMVVTILFIILPLFLPVPIQVLGVLMGTIQAMVFTMLPVIYIASFIHGH